MVTRVVLDGKRKVMISAAARFFLFLFSLQSFSNLFFQGAFEESDRLAPGILRVFWTIAILVIGVFKSVSGIGIDGDVDLLALLLHRGFEGLHVIRSNAAI